MARLTDALPGTLFLGGPRTAPPLAGAALPDVAAAAPPCGVGFVMTFHDQQGVKSRYRMRRVVHPCSKCGEERDRKGRYCRLCHSAYMRTWRREHPHGGTRKRGA